MLYLTPIVLSSSLFLACAPALAQPAILYQLDDGMGEISAGPLGPTRFVWGNYFLPTEACERWFLDTISVVYASVDDNRPVKLCVYEDLDGDGNPINATLRLTFDTVTASTRSNTIVDTDVIGYRLRGHGGLFVAVVMDIASGERPARRDTGNRPGQSWIGFGSTTWDIADLSTAPTFFNTEPSNPGTWMIRASLTTAAADCRNIDLDDGTGTGTSDGGVDINDLTYFLAQFESGGIHADLDDGTGTGVCDGGVDVNDLTYFLAQFDLGC